MRPIHALPVVLVAAALAGCGGGGGGGDTGSDPATTSASPPAQTQTQTQSQTQTRTTAPAKGPDGAQVFASAGCASCHTLSAANASGNVGPNLDDLQPDFAAVQSQVENGGGGMPSFSGDLSQAEIDAVARYVSDSAGQ